MRENGPFILSIGGLDPSGGAGVFSDIKTYAHFQINGLAVSTCLTGQTHDEVIDISWVTEKDINLQLKPLLGKYSIEICKISVIQTWEVLNGVIDELLNANSSMKIIVDPVLVASSGYQFCPIPEKDIRNKVLSKIFLITPNESEFKSLEFVRREPYECNILLKSAKGEKEGTDILFDQNGASIKFQSSEIGSEKHGSGCVLSSSIASYLALGKELVVAIAMAKQNIEKYLLSSTNLIGTLNI